jgi:hypothetical protein
MIDEVVEMNTESNMNEMQTGKMCIAPEIGQFVPDYIVDMLSDSEALKVELHLVACFSCKEHYHTVLRASAEMRELVSPGKTGAEVVMLRQGEKTFPAPKGQFVAGRKVKYARKASGSI